MTGNEYQKLANRTLIDAPDFEITSDQYALVCNTLLVAGQSGNLSDYVKKGVFHQKGIEDQKLNSLMNTLDSANRHDLEVYDLLLLPLTAKEAMIAWNALGLAGETGEVINIVNDDIYFNSNGSRSPEDFRENIKKELGDVMWYVAAIAKNYDLTLDEVMSHNIEKLKARFPDGWNPERSSYKEGIAS